MSTLKYWNGTDWTAAFPPASTPANEVTDYTSSVTWTQTPSARFYFIEMVGGGGAGSPSITSGSFTGAIGGVGGQYFSVLVPASALAASVALSIGAGATAEHAEGGATTFGPFTAYGGNQSTDVINSRMGLYNGRGGTPAQVISGSTVSAANADLGAGSGGAQFNGYTGAASLGGTDAAANGLLQAGNGGAWNAAGQAPGGGGGAGSGSFFPGASGAVRVTAIF